MSWVPRVVGPLIRAVRQIGYRKAAYTAAKQTLKAMNKFPKAKKARTVKKSRSLVGPMPFYRRRRILRRKPLHRRRRYGKKTANKIHTYVRWCDKDTSYPGSSGPSQIIENGSNQHLAYTFTLANLVNVGDFVNLYDSYRINKVQLYLEPTADQANGSGVSYPVARKIRVVHDYNDANPLTSEDDYLEYNSCKSYFPFSKRGIRITLYPKINNTIENVGGVAGFTSMNSNRVWLNTADDAVPHFGLKIFVPAGLLPNENLIYQVRAKYWISCKTSK